MKLWSVLFYGPGDWLASRTSRRGRCAFATWVMILWLGPGTAAWLLLLHELWFIGWMSLVALWLSAFAMVAAETPVEHE